jgi:ubiquinone/menaquinone biosynthesis C-methylase UbiE
MAIIMSIPFGDSSFDCVVCLSVLEFIKDLNLVTEQIYRVTEKGGIVLVGAPVLNTITDQLYYICGNKDHKSLHKSNHIDIIDSFKRRFHVGSILTFPRLLSLKHSLFFVMKCRKQ